MPSKKIIAIVGATGNQGSSVAHTFLSLPGWVVRCLTRNPSAAKAQQLAAQGAEVVQADLGDISSLWRAFEGAHAIFSNTDFWTDIDMTRLADNDWSASYKREVTQGKNTALAAANVATLERFVYSALPSMKAGSGGKYPNCMHWESKAEVVDFIFGSDDVKLRGLARKTSLLYMGCYNTNPLLLPRDTGKGYAMVLPCSRKARMPIVDPTSSTGPFVRALVEDEDSGVKLLAYDRDSYLRMGEILEGWCRATGKPAGYVEETLETIHKATGVPTEILDGPASIGEFGFMAGVEGFIEPKELKTAVQTKSYEEFLLGMDVEELV